MTIQDIGSIGELIAAIATVATLGYLAVQIRANTSATRAEAHSRTASELHSFAALLGGNSEAASIFTRGVGDYEALESVERTQFHFIFGMLATQAEIVYTNYHLGIEDHDRTRSGTNGFLRLVATPGGREFWRLNRTNYTSSFQSFVESRLDQQLKTESAAQQSATAESARAE